MWRRLVGPVLGVLLAALPLLVAAQDVVIQSPITEEALPPLEKPPLFSNLGQVELDTREAATVAEKGALLRALDKISGDVVDFELTPDQTKQLGRIEVTLTECRFPTGNPAGDASAYLTVRNVRDQSVAFKGWMLASSPALNALDHPRYDVWVLRCITS